MHLRVVLSILLLATYPFMTNLHGPELKILINIASLLKNMFAVSPVSANMFAGPVLFFFLVSLVSKLV